MNNIYIYNVSIKNICFCVVLLEKETEDDEKRYENAEMRDKHSHMSRRKITNT